MEGKPKTLDRESLAVDRAFLIGVIAGFAAGLIVAWLFMR